MVENEIKSKMEQAGKLLLEADKMATKSGRELHFMEAVHPLIKAMEDIGWSTSSLNC